MVSASAESLTEVSKRSGEESPHQAVGVATIHALLTVKRDNNLFRRKKRGGVRSERSIANDQDSDVSATSHPTQVLKLTKNVDRWVDLFFSLRW